MKKFVVFVVLGSIFCHLSWADSPDTSAKTNGSEFEQIFEILESSRTLNAESSQKIMNLSLNLTASERFELYTQYQKNGNWAWLNYPFGVGSLIMGDYGTTGVQLSAEVTGVFVFGLGFASGLTHSGNQNLAAAMTVGGSVTMLSGLLYGMIRPWFFAAEQNRLLSQSLRVGEQR